MATSAEQINALIAGNVDLKAYYEGARGGIDADRAAMRAQVDAFTDDVKMAFFNRLYVDQVAGNDASTGLTAATAIASIKEAFSRAPEGGLFEIRLIGDYKLKERVFLPTGCVSMRSQDTANPITLSFAGSAIEDATSMPRFFTSFNGSNLFFNGLTIELGTADGTVASTREVLTCSGLTNIVFREVNFVVPAGSDQVLMGGGHGIGFALHATTASSEMAGRWVSGVAAATDPATIYRIAWTNLNSL